MAEIIVFYSWQSDLPNPVNRGFIQSALERAASRIRTDETMCVIDRDTQRVPGSPNIAETIFEKIDRADAFLADVSIIHPETVTRRTPNPNVLIELGYALKALGESRIILVMNTAFGAPELLPFDLRQRRVARYGLPAGTTEKSGERQKLVEILTDALGAVVAMAPRATAPLPRSRADAAVEAINAGRADQAYLVRAYMEDLWGRLDALSPDFTVEEEPDELLIAALDGTQALVAEFAQVAERIAVMNARDAATGLYGSFGGILERYEVRRDPSRSGDEKEFDFFKFLGHELFTSFFCLLVREERWPLIAELLEQQIFFQASNENRTVEFERVSQYVWLLDRYRKNRLGSSHISVRAELLKQRHEASPVAERVPIQAFVEAEVFLLLRSIGPRSRFVWLDRAWRPWSVIYARGRAPRFLVTAARRAYAERLCQALGLASIDEVRQCCNVARAAIEKFYGLAGLSSGPFSDFASEIIGSQ